jgi:hypothetical protein
MAFLLYFVVILVSAASVMFGLDLMNSPLPSTPNVPIGRSAQVAPASAAKPAREAKRDADSRAISPVYPAYPAAPQQQAAVAPTPSQQPETAPPASAKPPAAAPAPSAALQPAVAQSNAHCDLQACAAAYHSFRASDCSYEPTLGVRRVCTRSGGAASARSPRPKAVYAARPPQTPPVTRGATDAHELDEVTRIVRKMTRGEDGDVAVQDSQGRIIIVHPGNARAYAPYD